ncbi:unnamed protein product, partial [Owenia fusiformis]
MRHHINITDSNFVNNTLSGIHIETYTGQVNIERVEASDNGDTGTTYIRLPEPSPQRKMMFCTPGVETTELSAGEAVEVMIDTPQTDMRSGCIQSFKTGKGWNILASFKNLTAVWSGSTSTRDRLQIRDGNATGTLLREVYLSRSQKTYTPDVLSTLDELWFRLDCGLRRLQVTLLIQSTKSNEDVMQQDITIQSSSFRDNGHGGVFIVEPRRHVAIENVVLSGNCNDRRSHAIHQNNCSSIIGGASSISVMHSTFDNDTLKITPDGRDV